MCAVGLPAERELRDTWPGVLSAALRVRLPGRDRRLHCMMMMMNYEMQLTAAASHVADKMLACSRISQSKSITYLLQMTLDLGNFLNYGAPPTRALAGAAAGRLASSPHGKPGTFTPDVRRVRNSRRYAQRKRRGLGAGLTARAA